MGVIVIFSTVLTITINIVKKDRSINNGSFYIIGYLILTWLLVTSMFPLLWSRLVSNLLYVFSDMSHFTRWQGYSLFNGRELWYNQRIPWYYSIIWITITTPIMYTLLMLIGVSTTAKEFIKNRFSL